MSGAIPAIIIGNPKGVNASFESMLRRNFKKTVKKAVKNMAKKQKKKHNPKQKTHKRHMSKIGLTPFKLDMPMLSPAKTYKKRGIKNMAKKHKGKKHERKSYRRNPETALALSGKQGIIATSGKIVVDGTIIVGGFLALTVLDNFLPVTIKANSYMRIGVKALVSIAVGVGMPMISNKLENVGHKVAIGMVANTLLDVLDTFKITAMLPGMQSFNVGAMVETGAGAMVETGAGAMVSEGAGLGAMLNKTEF